MEKDTIVISKGYDPLKYNGAVKPPIFLTSTYKFKSAEEGESFIRVALGLDKGDGGSYTQDSQIQILILLRKDFHCWKVLSQQQCFVQAWLQLLQLC